MDETEIDTKMGSSLPKNQIIGTLCLKEILNHNLILRLMLSNEIGCCFPGKIRRFFFQRHCCCPTSLDPDVFQPKDLDLAKILKPPPVPSRQGSGWGSGGPQVVSV